MRTSKIVKENKAQELRRLASAYFRSDLPAEGKFGELALIEAIRLEDEAYYGVKIAQILRRGIIGICLENQMIK